MIAYIPYMGVKLNRCWNGVFSVTDSECSTTFVRHSVTASSLPS